MGDASRPVNNRNTLVYRSTYTIFFTTTSQQGLCVHQPPTTCSVLHSSVRLLTGRSRLQHLPFGTLCRHQLDPLTLLVLLNLDLNRSVHVSIYRLGRFNAIAALPTRLRLGRYIKFVLTLTLTLIFSGSVDRTLKYGWCEPIINIISRDRRLAVQSHFSRPFSLKSKKTPDPNVGLMSYVSFVCPALNLRIENTICSTTCRFCVIGILWGIVPVCVDCRDA